MAEVTYYLRNPKAKIKSAICLSFRYEGLRLQCTTGWNISPKEWNFKKNFPKHQISSYNEYHEFLLRIRGLILDYYNSKKASGIVPHPKEIKEYFDNYRNKEEHPKNESKLPNTFPEVFQKFIEIQSKTQAERTIKKYKTLQNTLIKFQRKKRYKVTFESIDLNFEDKFRNYLLQIPNSKSESGKGMLNDSISKYFSTLKTFLEWALQRGYHTNTTYKKFKTTRRPKQDIISLTEFELERLYALNLSNSPRLERTRDIFCFGCFTGQRWSDIENFDSKNIKGNKWDFISIKTKKRIIVPFEGYCSRALQVLQKYNFTLPFISPQKFNDYIKEVGKLAEINDNVTIIRYSGNKEIKISKPKYEFMSSHMARRTAVTILLQKGVPPTTVMKLTGHADLRTLMKYENTSQDALEEALMEL
ncbi:MAG: site-specific integrase [Flammeovirgaceae bacterium]|nr:site-specific integrase [Flammeovirgaceae bacterium]